MAESKVFQLFLLVSFGNAPPHAEAWRICSCLCEWLIHNGGTMIFSTHALKVTLTEGIDKKGFEHKTEINVCDVNGLRSYNGCAKNQIFWAQPGTTKVVVYIRSKAQAIKDTPGDLMHLEVLSRLVRGYHYELLYLIVDDFIEGDERIISEFLEKTIIPDPDQSTFQIDIIGEGDMNRNYKTLLGNLDTYRENKTVFGAKLYQDIRAVYKGARSPYHQPL